MTNKESIADGNRDQATVDGPSHAHRIPERRRLGDFLKHRWPTVLGIAFVILSAYDLETGSEFYALLLISPLVYLVAAALDRPQAPWAALVSSIVAVVAMRALDIEPAIGLLVATLIFLVLGFARGRPRAPWGMPLQTAGMFVFGAIGLAVIFVDPDLGGYLVAAGLIGHGVWDIVHYWANKVAARSFVEWCAVYDILLAAAILFMT